VKKICEEGGKVSFKGNQAIITLAKKVVMVGKLVENDLYQIKLNKQVFGYAIEPISIVKWHERLGHLSEVEMRKLRTYIYLRVRSVPKQNRPGPSSRRALAKLELRVLVGSSTVTCVVTSNRVALEVASTS